MEAGHHELWRMPGQMHVKCAGIHVSDSGGCSNGATYRTRCDVNFGKGRSLFDWYKSTGERLQYRRRNRVVGNKIQGRDVIVVEVGVSERWLRLQSKERVS